MNLRQGNHAVESFVFAGGVVGDCGMALIATMTRIAGLILAGGRSSRMGAPKAFIDVGGESLVERIARILSPQVDRLAVSLPPGLDAPLPPSVAVLRDPLPTFEGPLAGVLAGLAWAARLDPSPTHLATVPVDLPLLPADCVARLAARAEGRSLVVAEGPGGPAPLVALWRLDVAPRLAAFIDAGERRVRDFVASEMPAVVAFGSIDIAGHPVDPFVNLNTPADVATLGRLVSGP